MQKVKTGYCSALILVALIVSPTLLFGGAIYFDMNGNVVNKSQHAQLVVEKEKAVGLELTSGYASESKGWKDPIKMRKRRIEQWKKMRAKYNPASLPAKIEREAVTR